MPLDSRLYLPVWEGQVRVLGGAESHRGSLDQRFIGRDHLFGNLTLHHDLFNAGGLTAGGLLAFVDAGRVFEESEFDLTTEGMEVGVGGGVYFRLMQTGIYTFNFANGPDGFVFTPIETGREAGKWIEIKKGLHAGDVVASDGVFDLKNVLLKEHIESGEGG